MQPLPNCRARIPRARPALRRSVLPRQVTGLAPAVAECLHDIRHDVLHERSPGNLFSKNQLVVLLCADSTLRSTSCAALTPQGFAFVAGSDPTQSRHVACTDRQVGSLIPTRRIKPATGRPISGPAPSVCRCTTDAHFPSARADSASMPACATAASTREVAPLAPIAPRSLP